mgnify:CR=1 FL=1
MKIIKLMKEKVKEVGMKVSWILKVSSFRELLNVTIFFNVSMEYYIYFYRHSKTVFYIYKQYYFINSCVDGSLAVTPE